MEQRDTALTVIRQEPGAEPRETHGEMTRRRPGRRALLICIALAVLGVTGAIAMDSGSDATRGVVAAPDSTDPTDTASAGPRVLPPKELDGPPPSATSSQSEDSKPSAGQLPVTPPGKSRVIYPDGTAVTWPAPASGRSWVDPDAGETEATWGGRQFADALRALVHGSEVPPEFGIYQEGKAGRVGSYGATVVDGHASYDSKGAVDHGRFVIARATRGGTSVLGSDYDRCGRWPSDGNNLGMEGLTPTAPAQKLPDSAGTLRCSLTRTAGGLVVVHAERSAHGDPKRPGSASGIQRDAFTILPDGTAVSVSSSAVARTGEPTRPRDWGFLDRLLLHIKYPESP
ncbi:hypothetical protein [Streptomyces sp. GbtcB7]|uniref:hypothetical protein n=1 Tax=Streptomyces sp. GbtcB7 TaxID=2824752 RepID=UPI001C2F7B3C|nr:hypothetical protein [Streptomyces sp. GbtcB7]